MRIVPIAAAFRLPESPRPMLPAPAPAPSTMILHRSVAAADGSLVELVEDDRPLGPEGRGEATRYRITRTLHGVAIESEGTDAAGDARLLHEFLVDRCGGPADPGAATFPDRYPDEAPEADVFEPTPEDVEDYRRWCSGIDRDSWERQIEAGPSESDLDAWLDDACPEPEPDFSPMGEIFAG
jgi:hypothetical protein